MNVPVDVIVAAADAIRSLRADSVRDAIEIGRLLAGAKTAILHGEWGDWLRNEFAWTASTSGNFMRAAAFADEHKFANFANLELSILYALARPSCPEAARSQVLALAAAGPVAHREAARIIKSERASPPRATETLGLLEMLSEAAHGL